MAGAAGVKIIIGGIITHGSPTVGAGPLIQCGTVTLAAGPPAASNNGLPSPTMSPILPSMPAVQSTGAPKTSKVGETLSSEISPTSKGAARRGVTSPLESRDCAAVGGNRPRGGGLRRAPGLLHLGARNHFLRDELARAGDQRDVAVDHARHGEVDGDRSPLAVAVSVTGGCGTCCPLPSLRRETRWVLFRETMP